MWVAERHAGNILTFGFASDADVRDVDTVIAANGGTLITVKLPQAELCLTVAAPSEQWVSNALAILAAVESEGGDLAQAGLRTEERGVGKAYVGTGRSRWRPYHQNKKKVS